MLEKALWVYRMSLLELLDDNNAANRAPQWRGNWARLWLKPSIFSAQNFIVGTVAFDNKGLCDYRFISDTEKFECIYGESGRFHVDALIAQARQRLNVARECHEPITTAGMPPGFQIEPVGYVAGASSNDALESAMDEAEIPMTPTAETKAQRFKSRVADDVVGSVINAIRAKVGLEAEGFLRDDFFGDQAHTARVNIALPDRAGIIASGWYAGAERVQLELMRAAATVESYMKFSKKPGEAGVFFLRPTVESGLKKVQSEAIETALSDVGWLFEQKGLRVVTREFESELAEDVAEWAQTV
jgi:hypothetical protein